MLDVKWWLAWIIMFVVLELTALVKGGGTLTSYVKKWGSVKKSEMPWTVSRATLLAVLLYLTGHFMGVLP